MRDIPIKNPDVLKALNNFLWYYENRDIVARNLKLHGEAKDRKHFMSEKYRDEIIAQDTAHEGFPDIKCFLSFASPCNFRFLATISLFS